MNDCCERSTQLVRRLGKNESLPQYLTHELLMNAATRAPKNAGCVAKAEPILHHSEQARRQSAERYRLNRVAIKKALETAALSVVRLEFGFGYKVLKRHLAEDKGDKE